MKKEATQLSIDNENGIYNIVDRSTNTILKGNFKTKQLAYQYTLSNYCVFDEDAWNVSGSSVYYNTDYITMMD